TSITTSDPGFSGVDARNHLQQHNAGTGDYTTTQFSLEPPDQGLCTDGTDVMETVNNALAEYDANGNVIEPAAAMRQFFHLAPEIDRRAAPAYVYGPFISDPRCYYDSSTSRWFVSELEFGVDPSTDAYTGDANELVAVSQTSDPTGGYNLYQFDVRDDGTQGTPSHPGCPCFGDQPLLGVDAYGAYISTNEYPLFNAGFNGAQVYGMSKGLLESGAGTVPLVHFQGGDIPDGQYPGGASYSIQPAEVPTSNFDTANGGTEDFLSGTEFTGYVDNRIITWAMTNTSDLATDPSALSFSHTITTSETYGMGGDFNFGVKQNSGPRPLEKSLPGQNSVPEEIAANDDRMNQVVYADGLLWSAVNTATVNQNGVQGIGVAYFIVNPETSSIENQGYVSVNGGTDVFFPSIGVNDRGNGVMGFSLSGPSYYPSTAYVNVGVNGVSSPIHLGAAGQLPDDGFSGYPAEGGAGIGRWGDYSAAIADPSGKSIWLANEYIPNDPRTQLANWGTFISNVNL
ncbi:MAG: hypothetical protein ACRDFS_08580, partial [Chloroflexota bacterium]